MTPHVGLLCQGLLSGGLVQLFTGGAPAQAPFMIHGHPLQLCGGQCCLQPAWAVFFRVCFEAATPSTLLLFRFWLFRRDIIICSPCACNSTASCNSRS
jgi:hypothetical protein